MKTKRIPLLALGIALAIGAAACGGSNDSVAIAAEATTTAAPVETTTTAPPAETTTAAPAETTTTTEPPVPGEAKAAGETLETMNDAVGLSSPTIEGYDYLSTDPISWGADGPAAVLFAPLGDWCPHCSIHLNQLTDYLADNEGSQAGQVLLVTSEEQPSAQYPQDEWLTSAGWPYATVLDSLDVSISKAFGITSVPVWILVGSDGTVAEVIDGHHASPAEVFTRIDLLE